ncbi:hypothetical protein HY029_01570 [Candidatus Gottesmanbacteria bacterium]|nr:hypothetical protein [Candidatus Gottesmanbacteria bacterium]
MKSFTKLPLYLGLTVLVFSIILSVVKVSNQQAFTSTKTRANTSSASLILKYSTGNLVSLLLTSDKDVKGVDVTLKFNADKINILPSSLSGGPAFILSGGNIGPTNLFTFSAIAKKSSTTAGLVASFAVTPKSNSGSTNGDLQFVDSGTAVIDKAFGQNILGQTQGVKFTISK